MNSPLILSELALVLIMHLCMSAEATLAGAKAAAVATIASAIPTVGSIPSPSLFLLCSSCHADSITTLYLLPNTNQFANLLQLASVRMLPWAKANINPTGQALIISTGNTADPYIKPARLPVFN